MDLKSQTLEKSYDQKGRLAIGISGLDEMMGGGIPRGHLVVVVGDAGTGKTTLALQFIYNGLVNNESCILISIEEDIDSLLASATSYGWELQAYIATGKLRIIKLDISDVKSVARLVKFQLPKLIRSFGASRLVVDSITLFSMMFDDPIERRIRMADLNRTVKKAGITAMYTSETSPQNPQHSKDGIIEYSADGIMFLRQYDMQKDIRMQIRIVKMRRTLHDRQYRPYELTSSGIKVYSTDVIFHEDGAVNYDGN